MNNIKGSNKTEEQALEAKQVLLYGLNKVGSKILKKYEADYKPTKRAYVRKTPKEEVKEVKKVRVYDPEESDYDVSDLPFLNSEYERISKLEMTEENEDLQDKLYDVIDQIESIDKYNKSKGEGFNENVLKHLVSHITDKNEPIDKRDFKHAKQAIDTIKKMKGTGIKEDNAKFKILKDVLDSLFDKPPFKINQQQYNDVMYLLNKGKLDEAENQLTFLIPKEKGKVPEPIKVKGKITKGSPEALARAEKMRLGKEAKRIAEGKPPPKGKYVKKVKELEPYYNIGEIPSGFREATEHEAVVNGKVSYWGKYEVNPDTISQFKNVGFLFKSDLTVPESKLLIGRMITRMKGALRDIPFVENRLENIEIKGKDSKYYKNKADVEQEGELLKVKYKTASKMIDVLVNHIKKSEPSFTSVIKPKKEVKVQEVMKVSEKTPEVHIRVIPDPRKPNPKRTAGLRPSGADDAPKSEMKKSQIMDTMTWMEKTGKHVDIESKVHIKAGLNPKIKGMLKGSLNDQIDKEISGKGIKPKNISIDNTYNNMDNHASIDHHLKGLLHHLGKAGIKGTGIKHAFEHLGHQIKSAGENANSALSKTNTYQALAKGKNMSLGDLGNSISGDTKAGISKMGMGVRRGKISLSDSDSDSECEVPKSGKGFKKGSAEAKAHMAKIRGMKKC